MATGGDDGTVKLWAMPSATLEACLIDVAATGNDVQASTYTSTDAGGISTAYALPCGAAIPSGAVCLCNRVAGGAPGCACVGDMGCSCDSYSSAGSHYWYPN